MHPLSARFQRWPRPLRLTTIVLAALYLLYLVAGNLFLNTPLFDAVTDRKPEKFHMDTGAAVTLLPGHVIAWNVRLRGHVNHTVYVLQAERASARLALWPLLRREVRIPSLQAHGVSADIQRVADAITPPPRGDRGWTLRFDAIHSDSIRSARLETLLLRGHGRGTVGFVKQLRGGPSELLPSQVAFSDAEIRLGDQVLLDEATIRASFHYPRHYRDQAPGIEKFGILQAALQMQARSRGITVDTGGAHARFSTQPATTRMQADITLDKGTLAAGSRLVWRLPLRTGVDADDRGLLALQMDVAEAIRLQVRLPGNEGDTNNLHADLQLAGRELPLKAPAAALGRLSGQVKGQWQFESLNWIADLFVRKPWFRLDGGGLLRGDLQLRDGALMPGSEVEVPRVNALADAAQVRLQGIANARGTILPGTPNQARLDVALPHFVAMPVDAPKQRLFEGRDLRLTLSGEAALQALRNGMRAQLVFNNATVPDITTYNRYLGNSAIRLLGGTGTLSGQMTLDGRGRIGTGSVDLQGRATQVQVAGLAVAGDARLRARLQRADFDRKQFDLAGSSLSLHGVRVGSGKNEASNWWGEVNIARGTIDAAAPFQVDAAIALRLRDAAPLLAVIAERADHPRWVLGLLDAGEVQADGRLRWNRGRLLLDGLQAENKRVSLRARMDLAEGRRQGDLYMRWGVLGAALELQDEQRTWHLAGARDWYDSRPALLPAPASP